MPRQTLDAGWVGLGGALAWKGRALLIERQWKTKSTHPKLSPGDAGEVSYYNLEKQTPVKSCFFLRRKGGRVRAQRKLYPTLLHAGPR